MTLSPVCSLEHFPKAGIPTLQAPPEDLLNIRLLGPILRKEERKERKRKEGKARRSSSHAVGQRSDMCTFRNNCSTTKELLQLTLDSTECIENPQLPKRHLQPHAAENSHIPVGERQPGTKVFYLSWGDLHTFLHNIYYFLSVCLHIKLIGGCMCPFFFINLKHIFYCCS